MRFQFEQGRDKKVKKVLLTVGVAMTAIGLVLQAYASVPVGFREQCEKQLWVTYRSFNKEFERTAQFAAMGITNRCFFAANTINALCEPYCEYPPIWKGFKKYDWSALDAQAEDLVKASPNARFMVMIDLNTPYWATHKFHLDSFTYITHAGVMPEWRNRTKEWMLDFIAYAEKRWGDRIGAYILSGGGTSEWYEYDRGHTSYAKNKGWKGWCKARKLSLGEEPPSPTALSRAAFENLVYDPATEPEKIAYWKFHNSITANAILFFANAARKAIPKEKEIGVFFGYYLTSCPHQTSFAHLDYTRVYASPDIDTPRRTSTSSSRPATTPTARSAAAPGASSSMARPSATASASCMRSTSVRTTRPNGDAASGRRWRTTSPATRARRRSRWRTTLTTGGSTCGGSSTATRRCASASPRSRRCRTDSGPHRLSRKSSLCAIPNRSTT